jgi:hypothetical protein
VPALALPPVGKENTKKMIAVVEKLMSIVVVCPYQELINFEVVEVVDLDWNECLPQKRRKVNTPASPLFPKLDRDS